MCLMVLSIFGKRIPTYLKASVYNIYEIDYEYWKSLYSGNDFTLCMFHWNPGSVVTMNIVKFGVGFLMSARSSLLAYVTVWDGNFNLHKV